MHDATDGDRPRTAPAPPLAFIYDRHATKTTVMLDERITKAKTYALNHGMQIGGWFVDTGDDALSDTNRPALGALCNTMASHTGDKVCLIHDWNRLSRDPEARTALRLRIKAAGGWTVTVDGQDDREPVQPGTLAALYRATP
jgi:DNA invertase Pin-like site-specific DNA recombinase